jgi:hypothetical protein
MIFVGVQCKTQNCNSTIALIQTWYSPKQATWSINHPNPSFDVLCTHCRQHHQYTKDDVALFEG